MPRQRINPLDSSLIHPLSSIANFLAGNELQEFTVLLRNCSWDLFEDKQASSSFTEKLDELVRQGQHLVQKQSQEGGCSEQSKEINQQQQQQVSIGIQVEPEPEPEPEPPLVQQKQYEQPHVKAQKPKKAGGFKLFEQLAAKQVVSKRVVSTQPFQLCKSSKPLPSCSDSKPAPTKSPTLAIQSTKTNSVTSSQQQQQSYRNQKCQQLQLDKQQQHININKLTKQMSGFACMHTIQEEEVVVVDVQQKSSNILFSQQQQQQSGVQLQLQNSFSEKQTSNVENQSEVRFQQSREKNMQKQLIAVSESSLQLGQEGRKQQSEKSRGASNILNFKQTGNNNNNNGISQTPKKEEEESQVNVQFRSLQSTVIVDYQLEQKSNDRNINNDENVSQIFNSQAGSGFCLEDVGMDIGKTETFQGFSTPQKTVWFNDEDIPDTEVILPQTNLVIQPNIGGGDYEDDDIMKDVYTAKPLNFSSEDYSIQKTVQNLETDENKEGDEVTSAQILSPIAEHENDVTKQELSNKKPDIPQHHNQEQSQTLLQQPSQEQISQNQQQYQEQQQQLQQQKQYQHTQLQQQLDQLLQVGQAHQNQQQLQVTSQQSQKSLNMQGNQVSLELKNKHTLIDQQPSQIQESQKLQSLEKQLSQKPEQFQPSQNQKDQQLSNHSFQQKQQSSFKATQNIISEPEFDKSKCFSAFGDKQFDKSQFPKTFDDEQLQSQRKSNVQECFSQPVSRQQVVGNQHQITKQLDKSEFPKKFGDEQLQSQRKSNVQECFSPPVNKQQVVGNQQQVAILQNSSIFSPIKKASGSTKKSQPPTEQKSILNCFSPPAVKQSGGTRNIFTPKQRTSVSFHAAAQDRVCFTPAKTEEQQLAEDLEEEINYLKMSDNNSRAPPELVGGLSDLIHSVTKSGKIRAEKSQFEIYPVLEEPEQEGMEEQAQQESLQSSRKRNLQEECESETRKLSKSLRKSSRSRHQNDRLQASILDFYHPQSRQPSTAEKQHQISSTPQNPPVLNENEQNQSIKFTSLLMSPPKSGQQLQVPTPVSWPPSTSSPKTQQQAACKSGTPDLFKVRNSLKDVGKFSPFSASLQISRLSDEGLTCQEEGKSRKGLVFGADQLSPVKEQSDQDMVAKNQRGFGKALFQNQQQAGNEITQQNKDERQRQIKVNSTDQTTDDFAGKTDEIAGSKSNKSSEKQIGAVSESFNKVCSVTVQPSVKQESSKVLQSVQKQQQQQQQQQQKTSQSQVNEQEQENQISSIPKIKPTDYRLSQKQGKMSEAVTAGVSIGQAASLSQQQDIQNKGKRNNMVSGLRSFVQPKLEPQKPAAGGKPVLVPALEQAKKAKIQEEQKARKKLEDKTKRNQKVTTTNDGPKKVVAKSKPVAGGIRGRPNNQVKQGTDSENDLSRGVFGIKQQPFSSKLVGIQPFCSSAKQNQQPQLQQQKNAVQKAAPATAAGTREIPAWTTDAELQRYFQKPVSRVNPYDIFYVESGPLSMSVYAQVFPHLEYRQNKRDRESVEWVEDVFDTDEFERDQQFRGYIVTHTKRQKTFGQK